MRERRSFLILTASMVLLATLSAGFLLQRAGATVGETSSAGVQLFQALAAVQLLVLLVTTPLCTAGAISGERERRTWELLLVTPLSAFGIVCGKLVSGVAFNVLLLFASLPLFGLVAYISGFGVDELVHLYIVFLATALLLGTVSILVSAVTRTRRAAIIASTCIAFVLGAGVTLLAAILENWGTQLYSPPGPQGPQLLPLAGLTPLAQIDPFVALGSVLPGTSGGSFLGGLATVHHAFGLPLTAPLWLVYAGIAAAASAAILALTARMVRREVR
jgi:ABC-type transport system involved in multi-copper enzyme maturation permease subunit